MHHQHFQRFGAAGHSRKKAFENSVLLVEWMVRRRFLWGPAHPIDENGLTSVQMGDRLGRFYGIVRRFRLDFLARDGQSDIHRVSRSRGTPLFATR
jgi:hypothetical protein